MTEICLTSHKPYEASYIDYQLLVVFSIGTLALPMMKKEEFKNPYNKTCLAIEFSGKGGRC